MYFLNQKFCTPIPQQYNILTRNDILCAFISLICNIACLNIGTYFSYDDDLFEIVVPEHAS